jgi:hypothetical protein
MNIFKESIKIPTIIPPFEEMTEITKLALFPERIYFFDGDKVKELDPREVVIDSNKFNKIKLP